MGPENTLAWLDAALKGEAPVTRVLLCRLRRLAVFGAESSAGKTASRTARNRHWQRTYEECLRFPDVAGHNDAALWAADLVGAKANYLRTRPWMKKRK